MSFSAPKGARLGYGEDAEGAIRSPPSLFLVRVRVYATPTYSFPPQLETRREGLIVHLVQGRILRPIPEFLHDPSRYGPAYTERELPFAPVQIPCAPLKIEISAPGGQHIEAALDLSTLQ